jgi:hypothetical protein
MTIDWNTFAEVWDENVILIHVLNSIIEAEGIDMDDAEAYWSRRRRLMDEGRVRCALGCNTFSGFVEDLGRLGVSRACDYFGRWMPEYPETYDEQVHELVAAKRHTDKLLALKAC